MSLVRKRPALPHGREAFGSLTLASAAHAVRRWGGGRKEGKCPLEKQLKQQLKQGCSHDHPAAQAAKGKKLVREERKNRIIYSQIY